MAHQKISSICFIVPQNIPESMSKTVTPEEQSVNDEDNEMRILPAEVELRKAFNYAHHMIQRVEEGAPTVLSFTTEIEALKHENSELLEKVTSLEQVLSQALQVMEEKQRTVAEFDENGSWLKGLRSLGSKAAGGLFKPDEAPEEVRTRDELQMLGSANGSAAVDDDSSEPCRDDQHFTHRDEDEVVYDKPALDDIDLSDPPPPPSPSPYFVANFDDSS
mmetsp:Transcript_57567/g.130442  ORF Transcript_57567/g.130442 Transcript_57567/m.130442 type:complete len:219 (+) Transcript_57567:227-883(+)